MGNLRIHTGNRLEDLAASFAELVRTPADDIFKPEIVVVQSHGMKQYLSLFLADHNGIAANIDYRFPGHLMRDFFRRVSERPYPFDPEMLAWKILRVIPSLIEREEFKPVQNYLAGASPSYLYSLSRKIADMFDNLTLHRFELVREWTEKPPGRDWRAVLWRECLKEEENPVLQRNLFFEFMRNNQSSFPRRISVFGVSALPALYVRILAEMTEIIDIQYYFLSPSPQTIAEAPSVKNKFTAKNIKSYLHFISSVRRESVSAEKKAEFQNFFRKPEETTLLKSLQADLLEDRESQEGLKRRVTAGDDRSIQFHICRSAAREVEALKNTLIDLFEHDGTLSPEDVIVMTPEIEKYAPLFQSVFQDSGELPSSISDILPREDQAAAEVLNAVLSLSAGNFAAGPVYEILESSFIRRKYSLSENEIDLVRNWISDTGIRFGLDETERAARGCMPERANTWRSGLDRLLLGYALSNKDCILSETVPFTNIEGSQTETLGKLMNFIDSLEKVLVEIRVSAPLHIWSQRMLNCLNDFLGIDLAAAPSLFSHIHKLQTIEMETGCKELIDLETIRLYILGVKKAAGSAGRFLSGGITFCALLPMRSIPFRVVCLAGMNEGIFPSRSRDAAFTLMRQASLPGEPDSADEDRQLFLEIILSARDRLIVSCTGSGSQKSSQYPSAPVNELLEYLDECFVSGSGAQISEKIVCRHRLQEFHADYFSAGSQLFSYSKFHFHSAKAQQMERKDPPRFLEKPLPLRIKAVLNLDEICRYYKNPSEQTLRGLEIFPGNESHEISDEEPVNPDSLESYLLKDLLLRKIQSGDSYNYIYNFLKYSGRLPHGIPGTILFDRLYLQTKELSESIDNIRAGKTYSKLPLRLRLNQTEIRGIIPHAAGKEMLYFRPGELKPMYLLDAWIQHLACACAFQSDFKTSLVGFSRDSRIDLKIFRTEISEAEDCSVILAGLIEMQTAGLSSPLAFFPDISYIFAESLKRSLSDEEALFAAHKAYSRLSVKDFSARFLFGDNPEQAPGFPENAKIIYNPLLDHLQASD